MANQTITQLPDAGPITGTELVPIVQNGGTYKTTTAAIAASPSQNQTFLTKNLESTLPNSRFLSSGTGVGLVDGGAQSFYRITLNGVSGTLESMGNGFGVKIGGTMTPRSIAASGAGLSVANGDGQSGNPVVSLTGTAASLATNGGTGFLALPGNGSVSGRTLTGTANQIGITNPNGISGDPVFSISSNPVLPGTGGSVMPTGTTAERPGLPTAGLIRYNTTTSRLEGYTTSWQTLGSGDGAVTNVSGTANEITVANGTTTPVVGIADNPIIPGAGGLKVPVGVTTDRPGSPSDGIFRYNSQIGLFEGYANGAWDQFTTGGSGVTSVGLALPSDFTVSGSPITSAGTLTGAWASQPTNRVLASPNGSSGTPTFRALANDDLPNSGVTANTYGSSTQVPVVTVNSKGVITGVTLSTIVGTLNYQGAWNASTNTPTLTSSVGVAGYYYVVNVAGTTNLNGITDWQVGDWAIFNGTIWQKVDQTNTVSSVNGQTGAVSLTYSDVGAPSTSGVNATGTWGIDISGKAANITGGAAGDLVVQTATGVTNFIPAGLTSAPSNGKILIGNGTGFTVANLTAGTNVTITNTAGGISISSAGASVDDVIALAIALG
jgi:hypothetical protein